MGLQVGGLQSVAAADLQAQHKHRAIKANPAPAGAGAPSTVKQIINDFGSLVPGASLIKLK
jgi:hypothetical protein